MLRFSIQWFDKNESGYYSTAEDSYVFCVLSDASFFDGLDRMSVTLDFLFFVLNCPRSLQCCIYLPDTASIGAKKVTEFCRNGRCLIFQNLCAVIIDAMVFRSMHAWWFY